MASEGLKSINIFFDKMHVNMIKIGLIFESLSWWELFRLSVFLLLVTAHFFSNKYLIYELSSKKKLVYRYYENKSVEFRKYRILSFFMIENWKVKIYNVFRQDHSTIGLLKVSLIPSLCSLKSFCAWNLSPCPCFTSCVFISYTRIPG